MSQYNSSNRGGRFQSGDRDNRDDRDSRDNRKRSYQHNGQDRPPKRQRHSDDSYVRNDERPIERKFIQRSEEEHGIVIFLSSFPSLNGLTKQRRSDFIVREISLKQVVARLTTRDETVVPRATTKSDQDVSQQDIHSSKIDSSDTTQNDTIQNDTIQNDTIQNDTTQNNEIGENNTNLDDVSKDLALDNGELTESLLIIQENVNEIATFCSMTEDRKEELFKFIKQFYLKNGPKPSKTFTIQNIPRITEKDWRKSFHDLIREKFPSLVESSFRLNEDNPSESSMVLSPGNDKRFQKKESTLICFVCFKDNMTTPEAVKEIAKACHINPKAICFSGTKDKRGATTQFMTIRNVSSSQLAIVNKRSYGGKTLKVGTFSWANEPLKLGQLWGNEFTMCIRKIEIVDPNDPNKTRIPTHPEIEERVEALRRNGFVNYFGMQRFGTYSESTYKVGVEFLKGDVWKAIQAVLTSRTGSDDVYKNAIDEVLETKDFNLAISKVNRKFYNDEWNVLHSLSKNSNDHLGAYNRIPFTIRSMYIHSFQSFIWNWMVTKRIEKYGILPVVGDLVFAEGSSSESSAKDVNVVYITEENIHNYSIHDVIMPLPGSSVVFPLHEINEDIYKEFLNKEGINLEFFSNFEGDYHLYGGYRHIIVQPKNVTYELKEYTDYTLPLILTDFQIAKKESLPPQPPVTLSQEKKYALTISFSLPSSAYATMCTRELMHLSSTLNWDELNEKE